MSGWAAATGLAVLHSAAAAWLLVGSDTATRRMAGLCGPGESPRSGPGERVGTLDAVARRLRHPFGNSARERHRRAAVPQLCFALAAEMRSGRTPAEALERAVATMPAELAHDLRGVVSASRTGGDTAGALREVAPRAGADGLYRLAACWQVGSGSGAGFAVAVERLAESLRSEERHRQEITARLAGPRSTARLLAALPVLGLFMSATMGMRPFDVLFGSAYGLTCLGAGVGLEAAGIVWTRRLARRAEQRA